MQEGFGDVDESSDKPDTTDIRRAYFGVGGTYNKYYGFKLNGSFGSSAKLDVAHFDLKYLKAAQLRFGQFKTSMSLEERTSSRFLNFTERSYVNNELDHYRKTTRGYALRNTYKGR
jgi:phosphate-selective porin